MTEKLVFTYAYLMKFNGKMPDQLLNGDIELPVGIPGYFVGDPNEPATGNFEGRKNLGYAVAHAARKSRELSSLVDMDFEGLARDDGMTLLLQPIQQNLDDYRNAMELAAKHSPKYRLPQVAFERLFGKTRRYDPNFIVRATRVSEENLIAAGADVGALMLRDIYTVDWSKILGRHLTIGRKSDLPYFLVNE